MTFRSSLRVVRVEDRSRDGRGTWRLLQRLVYTSKVADRVFIVPRGFITDFASVPRIPLAFLLTGDMGHAAAVVHDWLYTTHEVDRRTADAVFREAAGCCDVAAWRAWLMWAGVRLGGSSAWDAPGAPQVLGVQAEISAAGGP